MWVIMESQTNVNNVNNTPPKSMEKLEKRTFISLLFFVVFQCTHFFDSNAQIIRFIQNPNIAEYYVFETPDSSAANYYVYKTVNPTEAIREGVWYVVDDPFLFRDKAIRLYRVKSPVNADFIVYYVRNAKHAGKRRVKSNK
jgi:hypothetical protein